MKVILKAEVDNLGLPGDVVTVADGYGRNYLIPRGMAILATRGAMKEAEALTRARKAHEAKTIDSAASAKEILEGRTLRVEARVDDRGHLYGSVSVRDIARVLKERGHDIEARRIDLKHAIKQIGTYPVPIRVHPQVTAEVEIEVVDEEGLVTPETIAQRSAKPPPLLGAEEAEAEAAAADDDVAAADAATTKEEDELAAAALEAAEELEAAEAAAAAEEEADAEATADQDEADDADETA
ncbi:MAG: 50S ribosomal protein L9 [Nitriliruptorales bacterium]|nr:50S ribosomal protein L9 [Nitriliruptorales bacterium]